MGLRLRHRLAIRHRWVQRPRTGTCLVAASDPLVDGETTSPAQRLLVVGGSANGLSGELPLAKWLFIPSTTTATIQRPPAGDWMLLDARTTIGPDGIGLTQAAMLDHQGFCASINQPLLVTPRG
ncbi:hypothetical protein [Leekyejoonella antrihumi]|uniref:hypothetical protein n=1 Tax=Leekyejoonella antrihumi TaxID=1660198 RepID=UPI003CCC8C8A